MQRVIVQSIKKNNSWSFGWLSFFWFHRAKLTWFHGSSQDINFSTYTGSDEIKTTAWTSYFSRLPTQELALGYRPRIAERPYLPGSTSGGFPEFLPGPQEGRSFPMAYEVKKPEEFDIKGWSRVCRELVDAELPVYGAILVR